MRFVKRTCKLSYKYPKEGNCKIKGPPTVLLGGRWHSSGIMEDDDGDGAGNESCKQLIGEVREPIPCAPGRPTRMDDEYVRNGVAEISMEVEPLAGKRHVEVTERRTIKDWARQIKQMLDDRYSGVTKVRLVMDNLNTHDIASLYETFEPQEARRLAERLDIQGAPFRMT